MQNRIGLVVTLLTSFLLKSCFVGTVKEFKPNDLKWFKPYDKNTSIIFRSANGELDTIMFYKAKTIKHSVRNIEQGFYDKITLSVEYNFTKGSYHQLGTMSDGRTKYDQHIFRISNSSLNDITDKEFVFIGITYSGNELNNIHEINNKTYYFDRDKATYPEINVAKGINNFTFNIDSGIVEYTDNRNVKWTRK